MSAILAIPRSYLPCYFSRVLFECNGIWIHPCTPLSLFPYGARIPRILRKMAPLISRQHLATASDEVITQEVDNKGVVILNRPKLLNTLHPRMFDTLSETMQKWADNKILVIIKGAGDKAFSAGGDVPALAKNLRSTDKFYSTLVFIHELRVPVVSLLNGIVFGGGAGLAVSGRYRIATEKALFAMPETKIGFFPNTGGAFFLPRLNGKLGWYLGLTGHRLAGADLKHAGLATHYCDSKSLPAFEKALLDSPSVEGVADVLNALDEKNLPEFSLAPVIDEINHCFSAKTMEEIMSNLRQYQAKSKWAQNTFESLTKMSPTSLKVTLEMLERGKDMSLAACLEMDSIMMFNFLQGGDAFEGMRAQFIDKDFNPKWDPPTLEEVTKELVETYFTKAPESSKI